MNILFVHEVDWIKKITYEIHHLSEYFSMYGHSVFAVDLPDPGIISFDKKNFSKVENYHRLYDSASVTLFRTPIIPVKGLHRLYAYFTSYRYIKKIIKENNIDIVFLFGVVTNGKATVKACKELEIPVVHRTLDVLHELVREKVLRNKVYEIEKEIYPKFDKVLCQTPFMMEWAKEMGSKDTDVISQGVDGKIMKPLPKDKKLARELGFSEADRIVMYLGTVYSFCGIDEIIKKMDEIIKKIPNFKLLVVGGGPDLNQFREMVRKKKYEEQIIFTDFIPYTEVANYCSLAEIFINPFRVIDVTNKLSPVKIFDLLSCEKPVIATPLKGLLHDFPEDANIIVYSELEKFNENIIKLLEDKSSIEMGKRGREYVQKNFTWDKVAEKILKEFEKLLK